MKRVARLIFRCFRLSAMLFLLPLYLPSCTTTSKPQNESDSSFETGVLGSDSATDTGTNGSTDSLPSDTTDSATETAETDLIDHSNETPLVPTADCLHPDVTADCRDGWCKIPKGCFIFGSVDSEGNTCRSKYAEDQVQVTLTHDFEIGQTETTQAQWKAAGFDLPTPITMAPCDDCPISWITIYEAMAYANALSAKAGLPECYDLSNCTGTVGTGCPQGEKNTWGCEDIDAYVCLGTIEKYSDPYACHGYRLPTTAEWEYAARAGTRTATYAGDFENGIPAVCISHPAVDNIAWHCGNIGGVPEQPKYFPVAQKAPNGFGLYDMLGNVEEYCASTALNNSLDSLVGKDGPLIDPAPELAEYTPLQLFVVLRGATYMDAACYARSSRGYGGAFAEDRMCSAGFRPVRTLDVQPAKLKKPSLAAPKKHMK